MIDFADGKMDVLVCTTIIESGLDIPNVNALIVNRADTFGLAQLYQLRGRVGRGARRAYAYLLIPASRSLTEVAEKRLKTMLAATELGAGFRIAMRDLEIRGAGNVLGSAQSGHIYAVGFELYTRLLAEAVETLRAQRAVDASGSDVADPGEQDLPELVPVTDSGTDPPVSVDLGIPASIPETYILDLPTRLGIYRRLGTVATSNEVDSMEGELLDRFGPPPWQVQNLLYVVRLKQLAGRAGVRSITNAEGQLVLQLQEEVGGARQALQRLMPYGFVVGHAQIRLDLGKLTDGWETSLVTVVEKLGEFRERLGIGLEVTSAG